MSAHDSQEHGGLNPFGLPPPNLPENPRERLERLRAIFRELRACEMASASPRNRARLRDAMTEVDMVIWYLESMLDTLGASD